MRGFRFGMGCVGEMIDILDISVDEIESYMTKNPIKGILAAIYAAAKCHAEDQDKPVGFSKNDVADWIYALEDGFNNETVVKLIGAFSESLSKKTPSTGEGSKKK